MELIKKHEQVAINEIIFNGVLEQSVEARLPTPRLCGQYF